MTDPKELRALLAKTSDGPWTACNGGKCSCKMVAGKDNPIATITAGDWGDAPDITYGHVPEGEAAANAAFIAAARSAVPALLDRVEALEAALKPFADLADYYQIGGPLRAVSGPIISVEDHRIGERTITVEHLFAAASLLTPSDRSAEQ